MPGAHLLLIEDDEVLSDLVERNLRMRGHSVEVARDVHTALELLQAHTFDLIILDINLPDKTGWDVLRVALRKGYLVPRTIQGQEGKLPVVVLSAVRVSSSRIAEFHPLAYLPKPFPMDALLRLAAEAAESRDATSERNGIQEAEHALNHPFNEEELHA